MPAILVYLLGTLFGLGPGAAAEAAVYYPPVLLMCMDYLAIHRAGRTGVTALADAAVAGLFGLVVVVAKHSSP